MDEQLLRETEIKEDILEPDQCKVFLINDDYSSFEFVVAVLIRVFDKSFKEAEELTMKIHNEGKGLAGVYVRDIAKTKVHEVINLGSSEGFPLRAVMEEV